MRLLRRYDRSFQCAIDKYFRFIANFYRREFLEVFLQPKTDFGLIPVITGILAGNIFATQQPPEARAVFLLRAHAEAVRRDRAADRVGGVARPRKYVRMPQPMNDLRRKLKELLIERLKFEDMTPDDIKDDDPLFAGGLGLDSIDALEIVVMLETEFGIKVKNESAARDNFHSVASLADFVKHRLADQQQAPV